MKEEIRKRIAAYAVIAAAALVAWWGTSRAFPSHRVIAMQRARTARVQATTLEARESTVRSGSAALEDSIRVARARVELLRELVPPDAGAWLDAEIRQLVAGFAERAGVEIRSFEEAAGSREAGVVVSTARVAAAGRYHDIGEWLGMVTAARRLVQLRDVRMGVGGRAGAGVEERTVVIEATLRWFRQEPNGAASDSTRERQ